MRIGHGPRSRGWLLGLAAFLGLIALMLLAPPTAGAAGQSYNLLRCHDALGRYTQAGDLQTQNGYSAVDKCAQAISDWSYQLKSYDAVGGGRSAVISWSAPPRTAITGISMDHDMRSSDGHSAEIQVDSTVLYRAPNAPGGFAHFSQRVFPAATARVILYCAPAGGCSASSAAHAFVRNVSIELTDVDDPSLRVDGGLIAGGWKRGAEKLAAASTDAGSGIRYLDALINGVGLSAPVSIQCNGQTPRYTIYAPPCGGGGMDITPSTAAHPFHNGPNTVQVVTKDFAGNTTWSPEYTVLVDNRSPDLAFANAQDPDDPELIRAPISDGHSGLASARMFIRRVGDGDWQPIDSRIAGERAPSPRRLRRPSRRRVRVQGRRDRRSRQQG